MTAEAAEMANANLFSAFAEAADRRRETLFLIAHQRTVSYGEMLEASAKAAAVLQRHGVAPGDRVVSQVEKSVAAVFLYLGCLRLGAVFIPLNTAYTPAEVAYFVQDAEPSCLVCAATAVETLRGIEGLRLPAAILTLEADGRGAFAAELAAAAPLGAVAARAPDDVAAILYTSGTTGRSKGAMLTHANLLSNVQALDDIWRWRDDDVLLHALPIYHAHGLFVGLHCAMLRACTLIWHEKFEVDRVLADLPRASVFMGVPTFYTRLLAHPGFDRDLTKAMRLFISGSAPLIEPVFEAFEARTGLRILERYGMTEALMITSNPYEGERVAGSVGYPLPGVQVRIADETGHAVAGEAGVLEITGPNVFTGYWRMPEKTASEFRADGWFITGDVAEVAPDGRVRLIGRAKDLVISGGFNVYPKEVELLLDLMDGVEESAVFGAPHPDFGEGVLAVVVARPGATPDPNAMAEALKARLAAFKRPKHIFVVDELPRNTMGKVQKAALRERYKSVFEGG